MFSSLHSIHRVSRIKEMEMEVGTHTTGMRLDAPEPLVLMTSVLTTPLHLTLISLTGSPWLPKSTVTSPLISLS